MLLKNAAFAVQIGVDKADIFCPTRMGNGWTIVGCDFFLPPLGAPPVIFKPEDSTVLDSTRPLTSAIFKTEDIAVIVRSFLCGNRVARAASRLKTMRLSPRLAVSQSLGVAT